jgi:hypothetical protein
MRKGFSYIEVLISIALTGILIMSSSYTMVSILRLKRRILYYEKFFKVLNKVWNTKETSSLNKKISGKKIKYKIEETEDGRIIEIIDTISGKKYFIYFSKIINL